MYISDSPGLPANTGLCWFSPVISQSNAGDDESTSAGGVAGAADGTIEGEQGAGPAGATGAGSGSPDAVAGDGRESAGLPPDGLVPPVRNPDKLKKGPPSRKKPRERGEEHLWDEDGGEWRYSPEDKYHNPHWDYNPHDQPNSPWQNIPIGGKPPLKGS